MATGDLSLAQALAEGLAAKKFGPDWRMRQKLLQTQIAGAEASTAQTQAQTEQTRAQIPLAGAQIETQKLTQEKIHAELEDRRARLQAFAKAGIVHPEVAEVEWNKAKAEAEVKLKAAQAATEGTQQELQRAQAGHFRRSPGAGMSGGIMTGAKWVSLNGVPTLLDKNAQPIQIEGSTLGQPPTTDMRNKEAGKVLVRQSVAPLKALSARIITKVGPGQRAEAIKRGLAAVFGNDPEFAVYQDARMSLAGNLAIATQGARPSDADIRAVWLPMVPDAYRDTSESQEMKWELINQLAGSQIAAPPGAGSALDESSPENLRQPGLDPEVLKRLDALSGKRKK